MKRYSKKNGPTADRCLQKKETRPETATKHGKYTFLNEQIP